MALGDPGQQRDEAPIGDAVGDVVGGGGRERDRVVGQQALGVAAAAGTRDAGRGRGRGGGESGACSDFLSSPQAELMPRRAARRSTVLR